MNRELRAVARSLARAAVACAAIMSVPGCSSLAVARAPSAPPSLGIVSIFNDYLPPRSAESLTHLSIGVRDFDDAVGSARIKDAQRVTVEGALASKDDLIRAIARFDGADTLTVAYLASHGSPEGLVLSDPLSFDELYRGLEAGTKGTVVLILDSCYAGVFAEVLSSHRSARIFAITGTKGPTLERWYSKSGSFSEALCQTIRERRDPGRNGKLTLGQLYDAIAADVGDGTRATPTAPDPSANPACTAPGVSSYSISAPSRHPPAAGPRDQRYFTSSLSAPTPWLKL